MREEKPFDRQEKFFFDPGQGLNVAAGFWSVEAVRESFAYFDGERSPYSKSRLKVGTKFHWTHPDSRQGVETSALWLQFSTWGDAERAREFAAHQKGVLERFEKAILQCHALVHEHNSGLAEAEPEATHV